VNLADFHNPSRCPLCGGANECQICSPAAFKGLCWCIQAQIPEELLAQVPPDLRNKACICRACVLAFQRKHSGMAMRKILPDDFYFDGGLMVFTAAHHLRRGYCCGSGCRHCPYAAAKSSSLPA